MNVINLPPNASILMESTRSIGYSLEAAIADIIDNSISANSSKIDIGFFPDDDPYLYIFDNGCGMNDAELNNAMQYGSKSPFENRTDKDLGRYGLGLKTASLSQCRQLNVISKKNNMLFGRRWDLDYIREVDQWNLIDLTQLEMSQLPGYKDFSKLDTGTLVVWKKLDKLMIGDANFRLRFSSIMNSVNDHLSLVFHRYLTGEQSIKKICICSNGVPISASDPFLEGRSALLMDEENLRIDGSIVSVRPYLLPHISNMTPSEIKALGGKDGLRSNQGFYIYRNKRLLVWGTWFRMLPKHDLTKLARVVIDIPNSLDHLWTLDIKKSTAIPPEDVRKNLSKIIEKIAEKGKRAFTVRGKAETREKCVHIWNRIVTREKSVAYVLNRDHSFVSRLCDKYCISKVEINSFLTHIETCLPINQIFVDMSNDNDLVIESEKSIEDVFDMLERIIEETKPYNIEAFINSILLIEPFSDYYDEIVEKYKAGKINE